MSGEQVVLSLLVFRTTGSSAWVGVVLALYYLPSLVAGVLGGAIADWMDRRRRLRRCELTLCLTVGVFSVALAYDLLEDLGDERRVGDGGDDTHLGSGPSDGR